MTSERVCRAVLFTVVAVMTIKLRQALQSQAESASILSNCVSFVLPPAVLTYITFCSTYATIVWRYSSFLSMLCE